MEYRPPSKRRYTSPLVRNKDNSKYVRIAYFNDEEIPGSLTKPQIWDRLIKDDKAVFVFDMETTKCYVYTIEYYEAHPELKQKHTTTYI